MRKKIQSDFAWEMLRGTCGCEMRRLLNVDSKPIRRRKKIQILTLAS